MALGSNNIDTTTVAKAIGVASHDVFTLCTSNNVNRGSKFKPGYISVNSVSASFVKPDGVSINPFTSQIFGANLGDFRFYNHAAVVPGIQGQPASMNIQIHNVGSGNTGYAEPLTLDLDLGEIDWWNKETTPHGKVRYVAYGASVWSRMRARTTLGGLGVDEAVGASQWIPCSNTNRRGTVTLTPLIQAMSGSQTYRIILEVNDPGKVGSMQLQNPDTFKLIDVSVERVFDPGMWPTPNHDLATNSFNGKYAYDVDTETLGVLSNVQDIRFVADFSFSPTLYGKWSTDNFKIFFKGVFTPENGIGYPLSEFQIRSTGYEFKYDLWEFQYVESAGGKTEVIVLQDPNSIFESSAYTGEGSFSFGDYVPGNGLLPVNKPNINGFTITATGSYVPNIKEFTSANSYDQGKGNIHGISLVAGEIEVGTVLFHGFPDYIQTNRGVSYDLSKVKPNTTGWMDISITFRDVLTSEEQAEIEARNQTFEIMIRDSNSGWKRFVTIVSYATDGNGYIFFTGDKTLTFHCNVPKGVNFNADAFMMKVTCKGITN